MKRILGLAAVAGAAVLVASTTAMAAPNAVVLKDSDLYKSETSNVVVDEAYEDDEIEVTKCGSKRCRVKMDGPDPWIRKNRIAPLDDEGDAHPEVPFSFGLTFGPGGPSVSIGVGSGAGSPGPSGPSSGPRACFFRDINYGGPSFCLGQGDSRNNFASFGWNDTVSSVRLYGGAGVQVCTDAGFGSPCYNYNTNQNSLGAFSDQMSSAEVY